MSEQAYFALEKGKRDSDRLVEDCLAGLALLLNDTFVQVNGRMYPIKVIGREGRIMLDIKNLPGFDHIEFTIEKTGWGTVLNEPGVPKL